jgi:hypothetical protein
MPMGRENIKDTIPAQTTSASIHVVQQDEIMYHSSSNITNTFAMTRSS